MDHFISLLCFIGSTLGMLLWLVRYLYVLWLGVTEQDIEGLVVVMQIFFYSGVVSLIVGLVGLGFIITKF
jgi:hypothetical protein